MRNKLLKNWEFFKNTFGGYFFKISNLVMKILFSLEKKLENNKRESPNKSGGVGNFLEKNKRGTPFIRDLRVIFPCSAYFRGVFRTLLIMYDGVFLQLFKGFKKLY